MFKVLDRAREIERAGIRIIHLELGNPRQPPPPSVIEAAIDSLRDMNVGYTSPAGLPALRDAVAQRHVAGGCSWVRADNIVIGTANLIINQFLDLVCDPGDPVVFFTPAFPTYWAAAAHIGLRVTGIPLSPAAGYELESGDVDAALAAGPRAIIVNSANNPTGAVYSEATLRYLASRCEERGIWLLSDETYADICYATPFFSMAALNLPNVVVMSSFSKVMSVPGYRIGYVLGTKAVVDKFALSNSTLISCLPIFSQAGCLAGLRDLEAYVRLQRDRFGSIASRSADRINRSDTLKVPPPRSGYYLFVDISSTRMDDMTFCTKLLEERHTAATPGRSFGAAYTDRVRIAFCGERREVDEGIDRIIAMTCGSQYKSGVSLALDS